MREKERGREGGGEKRERESEMPAVILN